jgi:general secretion pathway protein A
VAATARPAASGAASAALSEDDCERRLGRPAAGQQPQRQALPAGLVERLRALRGACVFERAGTPWLLWHERPRAAQANPVTETPQARQLQDQLVRHGALATSAVDGLYGPRTATALARFQSAHGLEISAVPDPLTALLLEKLDPSAAGSRHE